MTSLLVFLDGTTSIREVYSYRAASVHGVIGPNVEEERGGELFVELEGLPGRTFRFATDDGEVMYIEQGERVDHEVGDRTQQLVTPPAYGSGEVFFDVFDSPRQRQLVELYAKLSCIVSVAPRGNPFHERAFRIRRRVIDRLLRTLTTERLTAALRLRDSYTRG